MPVLWQQPAPACGAPAPPVQPARLPLNTPPPRQPTCMTPMTSMLPPLLACMAILSSASADILTLQAGRQKGRRSGAAAAQVGGGAAARQSAPPPRCDRAAPRALSRPGQHPLAPRSPPHRLKKWGSRAHGFVACIAFCSSASNLYRLSRSLALAVCTSFSSSQRAWALEMVGFSAGWLILVYSVMRHRLRAIPSPNKAPRHAGALSSCRLRKPWPGSSFSGCARLPR